MGVGRRGYVDARGVGEWGWENGGLGDWALLVLWDGIRGFSRWLSMCNVGS